MLLDRLDRASAELTGLGITAGKARQAVASGNEFRSNIAALERVQPEDLAPAAIEPNRAAAAISEPVFSHTTFR